jgi:Bacterial Ig-like domain (group 2)
MTERRLLLAVASAAVAAMGVACQNGNEPPRVAHLALSPPWVSIVVGDTVSGDTTVRAKFVSSQGDTIRADSVSWASTAPTIAAIDGTGLVRALRTGRVTIRGAVGGDTASQAITVTDPVLVGAGDMGTCTSNHDEATAVLVDSVAGTVFTLGDNDYSDGTPTPAYGVCFDSSWGRFKARLRPAPGDDDLRNASLADYYAYFGAIAHPPLGYYSYDLGTWHVVVLNVITSTDTTQLNWLRADLAGHSNLCTLAILHRPPFSSGNTHNSPGQLPVFQALYDNGAEMLLSGNDHDYERFGPQAPDQSPDPTRGVVEIVVGTGGKSHGAINLPLQPNSAAQNADTYGVLRLVLHPSSYEWRFIPVAGRTFTDAGSANCH